MRYVGRFERWARACVEVDQMVDGGWGRGPDWRGRPKPDDERTTQYGNGKGEVEGDPNQLCADACRHLPSLSDTLRITWKIDTSSLSTARTYARAVGNEQMTGGWSNAESRRTAVGLTEPATSRRPVIVCHCCRSVFCVAFALQQRPKYCNCVYVIRIYAIGINNIVRVCASAWPSSTVTMISSVTFTDNNNYYSCSVRNSTNNDNNISTFCVGPDRRCYDITNFWQDSTRLSYRVFRDISVILLPTSDPYGRRRRVACVWCAAASVRVYGRANTKTNGGGGGQSEQQQQYGDEFLGLWRRFRG